MSALPGLWHEALLLAVEYGAAILPLHHPVASLPGGCSCRRPDCAKPGKHPRTRHGLADASSHPEQIARWAELYPMGNAGGRPCSIGTAVFDVDGPDGERLAHELGVFDHATAMATTARGVHVYFRVPPTVALSNQAWPGLDVRHASGYVLVPPSRHPSGHVYAWRTPLDALADIPARLLAAVVARQREAPAARTAAPRDRTLPPLPSRLTMDGKARLARYVARVPNLADGRKQAAYVLAAKAMHSFGCGFEEARRVVEAWNRDNTPPLNDAILTAIIENAQMYGAKAAA